MKIEFDEDGTPLCPMERAEFEWDESGDVKVYSYVPCATELALVVTLRICPGEGDPIVWRGDFDVKNAVTSQWEFSCPHGHVLAVSGEDEDAEDFTWLKKNMLEHSEGRTSEEAE